MDYQLNELGFIERETGLNNTINIVTNGCNGSALICSGNGLVLNKWNIDKFTNGFE